MDYLELISVPAIATIVYWVVNVIKYAVNKEKFNRFIPVIAAVFGAILGVICFYGIPNIIPADNIFVAIVVGGASGLTATGANQLIKQLEQVKEENERANSEESVIVKEEQVEENIAPTETETVEKQESTEEAESDHGE